MANRLAFILSFLSFTLLAILIVNFGVTVTTPVISGIGIFCLAIILINNKGFTNLGRLLLSIVPVLITMYAALIAKINDPAYTDILYYDARFILILLSTIPCLVFDLKEYFPLYGSLGIVLLSLVFFDPIHEMLGVGYYQRGFASSSYFYINYVCVIAFVGIVGGAITLKVFIEKYEKQNELFKLDLITKNGELIDALKNIETQNEEILSQSEQLLASKDRLEEANKTIAHHNFDLENRIKEANSELYRSNQELVKRNNELSQFSYTISHNLRGPIARLLGLAKVVSFNDTLVKDPEAMRIVEHIQTSAAELDGVITDLMTIVDARNFIFQSRQFVSFDEAWSNVKKLLNISPDVEAKHFEVNFSEAPAILSVKPLINSIMYNLVSNSMKYRAYDRELRVSIRTFENTNFWVLQVEDNGLGIDMSLFQKDLFKIYKRFHENSEGKGLGLYLMKQQAETLNGFIEVNSEVNVGTMFSVYLGKAN